MADEDTTHDALVAIQQELKAPKSAKNTFGNFNYRNIEQINEAIKPLLKKHNAFLKYTDTIIERGDRIYVEATVSLSIGGGAATVSAKGYAREAETKKGMDEAQITGSASSYARKYAVQGLFALDDGAHDPDSKDNTESGSAPSQTQRPATVKQKQLINKLYREKISDDDELVNWLGTEYGVVAKEMDSQQAGEVIEELMSK